MRRLVFALALVFAFTVNASAATVTKKVIIRPASPQPSVSPGPDSAVILGLPQPSSAPTCVYGQVGVVGDAAGCVYACNSNIRRIIAGNACLFPTPDTASTPVAP